MNENLFRQVNTPAYIFSTDELVDRFRMIREALGNEIRLVYAVKANPFLIEPLIPFADGFEVCSPGEERMLRKKGVPAAQVVISGVNKDEGHIFDAMSLYKDGAVYTAESEQQLRLIERAASENGCRVRVLLRLTSGNQFGMDADTIRRLIRKREQYPHVWMNGIQFFSGTQKKPRTIFREIEQADAFICELRETFCENVPATDRLTPAEDGDPFLTEFEFGPGLPVTYFTNETPIDDSALLKELREKLSQMRFRGRITLEMGRYVAAYCGYYVTKVADRKTSDGNHFAILDGGIHQVNFYGQMMGMKVPHIQVLPPHNEGENIPIMLCGSLCTTADVIVREFSYPQLEIGDILVFERAGAYSVTEGIALFLSRDLPEVYISNGDSLALARTRIATEAFNI